MGQTECGIVGLPNVGKSGLFNALTGAQVASCNYPFCTIDPNVGVVPVIDPRLETLARISQSQKIIYADMKFVDIAGLVKGASKGEVRQVVPDWETAFCHIFEKRMRLLTLCAVSIMTTSPMYLEKLIPRRILLSSI